MEYYFNYYYNQITTQLLNIVNIQAYKPMNISIVYSFAIKHGNNYKGEAIGKSDQFI